MDPVSQRLRSDRPPVIVIVESEKTDGAMPMESNGTVRLISTSDYNEIWRSDVYINKPWTLISDVCGDATPELMVMGRVGSEPFDAISVCDIYDGTDLHKITRITGGPHTVYGEFDNFLVGIDILGGPERELLYLNQSHDGKHSGNSYCSWGYSTISILDGTTFDEIWRSERFESYDSLEWAGDLDNDSRIEALYRGYQDFSDMMWYAVFEFPKDTDISAGMDYELPVVDILSPPDNRTIDGLVDITGTARDDTFIDRVEVRIGDGPWLEASFATAGNGSACNWGRSWNASAVENGTYRISARSYDGYRLSPEVSISVTVKHPEPTPPVLPSATVGTYPDPACLALAVLGSCGVAAIIVRWILKKERQRV
jgi:hypothetical protein